MNAASSKRKLSEILMDVAGTFLPRAAPEESVRDCILAAGHLWNATRASLSPAVRREAQEDAELLLGSFLDRRARVRRVLDAMSRRLRREFAADDRRIQSVRFTSTADGRLRVDVLATGADAGEPEASPLVREAAQRIDAVLGQARPMSPVARRRALELLELFAGLDEDRPARRDVAVWAAAAVHAAFRWLPEPRLTADVVAARFGVKLHAVRQASLELRRTVPRDWLGRASGDSMFDGIEHAAWRGADTAAAEEAARSRARAVLERLGQGVRLQPSGSFEFNGFVHDHAVLRREADILWHSMLVGLRDAFRSLPRMEAASDPSRDTAFSMTDDAFCRCCAPALRNSALSEGIRVLLARYLAVRFFDPDPDEPDAPAEVPHGAMLAICVLARAGVLAGADLHAVVGAMADDRHVVDGLRSDELVQLAAALDAAEEVSADERVAANVRLFALVGTSRDAFAACACAFAALAAVPAERRRAVLDALADGAAPVTPIPDAARRSAALARALIDDDVPLGAAARLLERGAAAGDRAIEHAAADLIELRADDLDLDRDGDALRAMLQRGVASSAIAVRRRFYHVGVRLLGDEVIEWARSDRAPAIRDWAEKRALQAGEPGGRTDAAQLTIFGE